MIRRRLDGSPSTSSQPRTAWRRRWPCYGGACSGLFDLEVEIRAVIARKPLFLSLSLSIILAADLESFSPSVTCEDDLVTFQHPLGNLDRFTYGRLHIPCPRLSASVNCSNHAAGIPYMTRLSLLFDIGENLAHLHNIPCATGLCDHAAFQRCQSLFLF